MKASLLAPFYLSVSWVLTVTYQLFTDTAVNSVAISVSLFWPWAGAWLGDNLSIIAFIYAFTWIFVLSSVIPSLILGKQRSILVQYIMVLTLTLIAFSIADILDAYLNFKIADLYIAAEWLKNPLIAVIYLAIPYLFMIGLDIVSRRKNKKLELLKLGDLLPNTSNSKSAVEKR